MSSFTLHGFIRWMSFLAAYNEAKFWNILNSNGYLKEDFVVIDKPKIVIHDIEGNENVITKKEDVKVCVYFVNNRHLVVVHISQLHVLQQDIVQRTFPLP